MALKSKMLKFHFVSLWANQFKVPLSYITTRSVLSKIATAMVQNALKKHHPTQLYIDKKMNTFPC